MAKNNNNSVKPYSKNTNPTNTVNEPEVAYAISPAKGHLYVVEALPSVNSFLGSEKSNGADKHQFVTIIRQGVKKQTLEHLMKAIDISSQEMATIMHTSERTLRRYTANTRLNAEQSERVVELARLFAKGAEVFGSLDSFKEWMNDTIMALGNKKPKEFLDTSLGIEILMDELGRIEHGIFA